jgi:hypothetical protein
VLSGDILQLLEFALFLSEFEFFAKFIPAKRHFISSVFLGRKVVHKNAQKRTETHKSAQKRTKTHKNAQKLLYVIQRSMRKINECFWCMHIRTKVKR